MHNPFHSSQRRLTIATALVIVSGWMWTAPPDASAQFGWPTARVTFPTSGSSVGGTISVSADASSPFGIAGVQFQLDGVNLGAEDTASPWSVAWNTTTVAAGPHTLRAVARDEFGTRRTSDPVTVTVDNTRPTVRIDQAAGQSDPSSASPINFTAVFSEPVSAFTGASVTVGGTAGGTKSVAVTGGPSTYTVAVSGMSDGTVTVTVPAGATSDAAGNVNTASTSTDNSVLFNSPPAGGSRIEQTSTAVTYAGGWEHGNTDRAWSSGTAALSVSAGARATLSFTGTAVKWIGFRGPQAGRAHVYLDGARVTTVDLYAAAESVQAVVYEVSGLASGPHTLAAEVTGTKNIFASDYYVVIDAFELTGATGNPPPPPAVGDVFVSLEPGPVQWWRGDGTFRATLLSTVPGNGEGMGFDASDELYVTRWCTDPGCSNGAPNGIEVFDRNGLSKGRLSGEWDCGPHAIVFDAANAAYVGNAGCTGAIWKIVPGQPRVEYPVATENYGSFWIDLAPDGCTMFYTSWGPNVKRYNVCTRTQLPNFNTGPLPGGGATHDLRVLPDGGLLVSNGEVIVRLNASGAVVRTYSMPEASYWTGLDLVGDGTFWVGNYLTSNVYRFDIATGEVIDGFNTGTPAHTVVSVRVRK